MPNQITADGIEVKSQAELVTQFTGDMEAAYGADINLEQNTPDGQWMMNIVQEVLDLEDFLVQICNTFDPDLAMGVILDQRVAINGIQRQQGTKTRTNITIVTNRALNLYGLDQSTNTVFTVQDNTGNRFSLLTTQFIGGSGTYVTEFESDTLGQVITVPNTITTQVTIVLGVVSVNNPDPYTLLGTNEETDAALKIRRSRSVSIATQGYFESLIALLLNIPGITFANIHENNTSGTDAFGVPSHSIWVVVAGTATDAEIANAIYLKRNAGCGMYGGETYEITQVDGSPFIISWDFVEEVPLFIKFTATSLDGINPPNIAAIREQLPTLFIPGVYSQVNINQLATFVRAIDPNTLVTSAGFSTTSGGSYTNTLLPSTFDKQFVVTSADTIILAMILNPPTSTATDGDEIQFSTLGGYGTYTYTLHTNNSGATINGSTGLYTAGSTPGTDTVRVTDSLSNTKDATVVVS